MKNLLIILLAMISLASNAQYDAETVSDGNWSAPGTWDPAVVPGNTADVFIANGNEVTILVDENFTISDLWLSNLSIINIIGDLTIDTLHINNNATLNVSGSLTILGGASLANNTTLTINNTGTVAIEGDVTTGNSGTELIVDGIMTIDGDLTGSAELSGDGSITVEGDVDGSIDDTTDNVLPIQLTYFKAFHNENSVTINWQTATEENNDYFTIERSVDGYNYNVIATIPGAGNSMTAINYTYTDNNPVNGVSYYRLKQTDYDGAFEVFSPVSVSYLNESDLKVGPNPAVNEFNISMGGTMGTGIVKLYSLTGAMVKNIEINGNYTTVDISDLPTGNYMMVISANDAHITKRVVVQ